MTLMVKRTPDVDSIMTGKMSDQFCNVSRDNSCRLDAALVSENDFTMAKSVGYQSRGEQLSMRSVPMMQDCSR